MLDFYFSRELANDPDWYSKVEGLVDNFDLLQDFPLTKYQRSVRLVQMILHVLLFDEISAGLVPRATSRVANDTAPPGPPGFPVFVRNDAYPRFEMWVGVDRDSWGREDGGPNVGRRVYLVEWTGPSELFDETHGRFPHYYPEHWTNRHVSEPFVGRGWVKELAETAVNICRTRMLPLFLEQGRA